MGEPIRIDLSETHIVRSAEASLRRLGVETLDVFLLHVPDALMIPHEVAAAFDHLHQSGKVRCFGVSNFNVPQLMLLQKHMRQPLVVNQVQIGLGRPQLLADGLELSLAINRADMNLRRVFAISGSGVIDYCRLNNIQVQAWSPLRGGLLDPAKADPVDQPAAALVAQLALEKGATSAAVMIAWLLKHPAEIIPLVNTSSVEHLREACVGLELSLSSAAWYDLLNARLATLPPSL